MWRRKERVNESESEMITAVRSERVKRGGAVHMTEMINAYKCLVSNSRQRYVVCTVQ